MQATKAIPLSSLPSKIKLVHFGEPIFFLSQVEAKQESFKNEYDKKIEDLQKQYQGLSKSLQEEFFSKINKEFEELIEDVHTNIPKLAIAIARKVLNDVTIDEQALTKSIEAVLSQISEDSGYIELILSCKDWETLENKDPNWAQKYPKLAFIKDEKLKSGDFLLKSRFGIIDATLEKQLEKIQTQLQGI